MAARAATLLGRLEATRWSFGTEAARRRREWLRALLSRPLRSARDIERQHEALLAARAYPDDHATLALAKRALARFGVRADVRAYRAKLVDSGIAGADIRFAFFAPTARRLAAH